MFAYNYPERQKKNTVIWAKSFLDKTVFCFKVLKCRFICNDWLDADEQGYCGKCKRFYYWGN